MNNVDLAVKIIEAECLLSSMKEMIKECDTDKERTKAFNNFVSDISKLKIK